VQESPIAYCGLDRDVWIAIHLAEADEAISAGKTGRAAVARAAVRSHGELCRQSSSREDLASRVYALLESHSGVSKATTAQYLACLLEARQARGDLSSVTLRSVLPPYIVGAIEYVTAVPEDEAADQAGVGAP
jgi:putative ATP-dependent endonuclease of OLD family